MKIVIIGGIAAGAGCAARLRRLDEDAEIVILEKGEYISYANCGLPYHIGGVIANRDDLLVMPEEQFKAWFNVEIRTKSEVLSIDRQRKGVKVRHLDQEYVESYDKLLLATGSSPVKPEIPGAEDSAIYNLWTIPDMDKIISKINEGAKTAVVIGGGFIGLEAAENLCARGLDVVIVQHSNHVLPPVDSEMAALLACELTAPGIKLKLNSDVVSFERRANALIVLLGSGDEIEADLVVMSVGVKPNSRLAQEAKLELGARGHIKVNEFLETADPDIYAAGDVIEVVDPIMGGTTAIPLAGPANKQARIVAENMLGGRAKYPGSYGASVIKVGKLVAANVGISEERLKRTNKEYHKIYTHPGAHASYYGHGARMHMKLLFGLDGKILGAQAVGVEGVDKRIDVISCAMQSGRSAPELGALELSYAPPFNSAKDPVNFLGMIAQSVLNGDTVLAYADELIDTDLILDVREMGEIHKGGIPGALNIPLGQLRSRLEELDKSRRIVTVCQVGLRGYLAERILRQRGFDVRNLSGGYVTWQMVQDATYRASCERT